MKTCWLGTALPVSLLCLLPACRTLVPVTQSENRERAEQAWRLQSDSVRIYIRDSIHVYEKGDTVRIERWRESCRDRLHVRTDSVYIRDSVYREVPVPVAKPLNAWQRFLMKAGGVGLSLLAAGLVLLVLRLCLKKTLR
ncbi:MAG: hypothetical protein NC396_08160 [Bacteroides sp.]|nr:hypothetical protein [Bacteroides sp.]MCM1086310.1 hypothetical protein [Bacteroides sp.]